MVAFGHTAVGSAVGLATYQYMAGSDPVTGLLVAGTTAVISHYLADLMPHGHFFKFKDYKSKVIYTIIFDLAFSIILFAGSVYVSEGLSLKLWYVLFGIGGAQLPDVLDGLIFTGFLPRKGLLKLENDFHLATHWHGVKEKALMWSKADIWQVGVAVLAFMYLFSSL